MSFGKPRIKKQKSVRNQSCYEQLPTTLPCNYFQSNAYKYFFTFLARLYFKLKKTPVLSEDINNNEKWQTLIVTVAHTAFTLTLIIHGSDFASFYFKYK